MRNRYATQGACIAVALMKRPHTYMEMIGLGLSVSPWKRVSEYVDRTPGLSILRVSKKVKGEELTAWKVVKA